jgi:hypothetical protein
MHDLLQAPTDEDRIIFTRQIQISACFDAHLPPAVPGHAHVHGTVHHNDPYPPPPLTPCIHALQINVTPMHRLNRPFLLERMVWLLRYEPKKKLSAGMWISGAAGEGQILYEWTRKNGYVIFICQSIDDEFLLAVPWHWTDQGTSQIHQVHY